MLTQPLLGSGRIVAPLKGARPRAIARLPASKLADLRKHTDKPRRWTGLDTACRALEEAVVSTATAERPILLSDDALKHLRRLQEDSGGGDLLLRVGVKSGGCSGMSYAMDFEDGSNIAQDDTVVEYEGFKLVTDSMSLLYLFGMTLDYSNKLIGGGFIFQNPNAQSSCGCGKSFGV